ncbi:MAG: N-acetyltransferase [Anaerolineae bacterium]|nr:N-acetyltransferase [Anaerolineae bacterium]
MTLPPVTVRPVRSRAEWRTMIEFPWAVNESDPNWVPPLLSQRRLMFDRVRNPIWEYLDGECFIAWRGEQPVGVICAAVNPRHNEFHNEKMGFFGHFDLYEDQEAAAALLDAAADWVRARGMTALRGPLNLTMQDPPGCLVEGFEYPPSIMMPHNWPYYGRLIEGAGLGKVIDLWAWAGSAEDVFNSSKYDRMMAILDKQRVRRGITVRRGNVKELDKEIRRLQYLYHESWSQNWGFVPLTEREIDQLVEDLTFFYDERLGFFAERGEEQLGFVLLLPNFNQVLKLAYPRPGTPEWITLLKALWHWKIRPKINQIRVILLGVREAYRGQGIDRMLLARVFPAAVEAGYYWGEASWLLETNDAVNRTTEASGFKRYKVYRIYQRSV